VSDNDQVTHTPRAITLLGSTGSIGTQTLDLVARNPDRFRIAGLAAGGSNPELLAEQALATGARTVAVAKASAAQDLNLAFYAVAQQRGYSAGDFQIPEILAGPDAATELAARECDIVLNAIDGAAGLKATLAALEAGHTLALANKESLIIGGDLVARLAKPGQIVPVDSEHSALAQALRGGRPEEVDRLIVTASGGPFRGRTRAEMADVSPEQAMRHPTWNMGPLVTCNSSTLVNKGLEVIEAHLLFDIPFDRIEVVVHPQSIVHSMVQFVDGSTLAQASPPDMRLPIALALGWPDRVPEAAPAIDWTKASTWEFFPLDNDAFPSVGLAKQVGATGGTAPAVFNGANEECVAAFLAGRLRFPAIVDTIERVVAEHAGSGRSQGGDLTLEAVLEADSWARTRARELTAG
jgi:1-deoxy-D-xylulose-5-phosphate reductoisomerase